MVSVKMERVLGVLAVGICLLVFGANSAVQAAPINPYSVAGIEQPAEFEKTFAALQKAVASNNRNQVAELVLYPLRVNGWIDAVNGKSTVQFDTKPELIDNYDEIFTSQVREAIIKQKVAELFVNWQGVMVGKGEAWLKVSDKDPRRFGISAINLAL